MLHSRTKESCQKVESLNESRGSAISGQWVHPVRCGPFENSWSRQGETRKSLRRGNTCVVGVRCWADRMVLQQNGASQAGNVTVGVDCRGPHVPGHLDFPTDSEKLWKVFQQDMGAHQSARVRHQEERGESMWLNPFQSCPAWVTGKEHRASTMASEAKPLWEKKEWKTYLTI